MTCAVPPLVYRAHAQSSIQAHLLLGILGVELSPRSIIQTGCFFCRHAAAAHLQLSELAADAGTLVAHPLRPADRSSGGALVALLEFRTRRQITGAPCSDQTPHLTLLVGHADYRYPNRTNMAYVPVAIR